jgi:NAD(P)-dependent dehydrogenase (short-subunit alcohol dehydrogenase family)
MTAPTIAASYGLAGRTAFVTGGAAGIGFACARHLGGAGATVVVMDVREKELEAAVSRLEQEGVRATGWVGDVSDEEAVEALVDRARREVGLIDLLVNNAGLGSHVLPEQVEVAYWRRIIDINLTGSFMVARAVARHLLAAGRKGSIVNISSIGGSSALGRGNFSYSIAKAGVNQMTRELAVEWAGAGIRVNAVQPCQVNTPGFRPLVDSSDDGRQLLARMLRGIPLGRLAEADDVAQAVLFLSSDAAAMITGVTLPVDGGNLALNAGGTPR